MSENTSNVDNVSDENYLAEDVQILEPKNQTLDGNKDISELEQKKENDLDDDLLQIPAFLRRQAN